MRHDCPQPDGIRHIEGKKNYKTIFRVTVESGLKVGFVENAEKERINFKIFLVQSRLSNTHTHTHNYITFC